MSVPEQSQPTVIRVHTVGPGSSRLQAEDRPSLKKKQKDTTSKKCAMRYTEGKKFQHGESSATVAGVSMRPPLRVKQPHRRSLHQLRRSSSSSGPRPPPPPSPPSTGVAGSLRSEILDTVGVKVWMPKCPAILGACLRGCMRLFLFSLVRMRKPSDRARDPVPVELWVGRRQSICQVRSSRHPLAPTG